MCMEGKTEINNRDIEVLHLHLLVCVVIWSSYCSYIKMIHE